jgi:hypothetical protein
MKMELFVVKCFMEGCEECLRGNEFHIVGVFTDKIKAERAQKEHSKDKYHIHSTYVDITKLELNKVYHKPY